MTESEAKKTWLQVRDKMISYYEITGFDPGYAASKKLAELLGFQYPKPAYWMEIELTNKLKEKLAILNGPYGHTLLKVLEARRSNVHQGSA